MRSIAIGMQAIKRLSMLAAAVVVLGGCAATKPLSPQARSYYDESQQRLASGQAALLVDACLYRLEVGTSHVYPQLSQQHAQRAQQVLAQALEAKGVRVAARHAPFACTSLTQDYLLSLQQTDRPGGELGPITAYPLRNANAGQPAWAAEDEALVLSLLAKVRAQPVTADRLEQEPVQPRAQDMPAEQVRHLAGVLGAPYLWVAELRQQDVSAGRKIGMITLTSALTLGLSGGAYGAWSTQEDATGEMLALVDLEQGTMLWKRQANVVGRGVVDFESLMSTEKAMQRWADNEALVPFYAALPEPEEDEEEEEEGNEAETAKDAGEAQQAHAGEVSPATR